MSKLYLAYGSNLDHAQMKMRCPDAVYLGSTMVKDYKLLYRGNYREYGVATIEPEPGGAVPACIWDISGSDEAALDYYEGWPNLYRKETLKVELNGKTVEAMVYIMNPGHILAVPTPDYFNTLWRGYGDCGLDRGYLHKATVETMTEALNK